MRFILPLLLLPLAAPSEPFGFSNDARARFGRLDFAEAAFRFAAPRNTIRFRVR